MTSLPRSLPPSRDTSRVTRKDPLDASLKSCVSHSGRGLPSAASSLDTSAFTIMCRPGFKFCVERNPWDKVLSHYHMHAYREGGALSLDQYFARGKFPLNYPRYTNPSGSRIIVDRVVRYENLIDELSEIFARLNVPFDGDMGVRKKGHFRTDRRPYQLVFSPQPRQIVERVFAREIQLHGYRFAQAPNHEGMVTA